ncbi:MAG TPA: hypothetical protein VHK63_07950 [Candidatus Limnocylindria bacterium]|nr:hypothetical protein [Candidatus Limnocylindria bacterium]
MSWVVAAALLMLWMMGLVTGLFAGGLLHLLLLGAVGIALFNLLGARRIF